MYMVGGLVLGMAGGKVQVPNETWYKSTWEGTKVGKGRLSLGKVHVCGNKGRGGKWGHTSFSLLPFSLLVVA